MRDILLMLIVVPGSVIALRHPYVGILLWTWVSIMNPHRLAYGFAREMPIAMLIGACTLVGLMMTREKRQPFINTPPRIMLLLMLWMVLTTIFAFDPIGSTTQLEKVMKIDVMVLVALMLVRTKREMILFCWVFVLSLAFYGIKGGLFTIATGGSFRVWGPYGSYIWDNNHLAVALIMSIPLLRFLQTTLEGKWPRRAMTLAMVLCAASAIGSHSRGALLAITAMALLLWWRGKNKAATGVVLIMVAVGVLMMMPEEWWARMHTMQTYEQDQSAMGRINAWWMAFNLARDNFFGAGFRAYTPLTFGLYAPDPEHLVAAHSIYFSMLAEHGFPGLFIYVSLWLATLHSARWLRKNAAGHPEAAWCVQLGAMAEVSIIGFLVGGTFLSLSYFDFPYNLMALVAAARYWVATKAWEREPPPPKMRTLFGVKLFFGDRLPRPGDPRSAPQQA
ncbi:putative O-glycosylation ligase, exosortase A system-associated [Azoarcus sp. TTM-91]|uniref:putative O-glycosylation ligase, exosortase A system-associated n=1 Tax=Azoarcus sp. TTM-91 TaxID=2691581 RepID=UPI00145C49B8|nr:putative O-glycosylation ligase, exosortase A system-associated [Azoarcus sp. TTM-91]NMG33059.1 putative O-glycosylation ligase, exosortase A system-associated [Azoarcus sp. TTM-91]